MMTKKGAKNKKKCFIISPIGEEGTLEVKLKYSLSFILNYDINY